VQDILTAAWQAVIIDLPAALDPDPTLQPYSAPPIVELRLAADQAVGSAAWPTSPA
jgi:hypothetical protein